MGSVRLTLGPLIVFWAVVGAALLGGAVFLQVKGPLPGQAPASGPRPVVADRASHPVPASLPPSAAHPAPPLAMQGAAIPDPDPTLLEPSTGQPDRLLPRQANGRAPATLYAAAFDPAERHPRVALVLDGAGLDEALTNQAIAMLPSAVDLAFSAYAPQDRTAMLARYAGRQGRECLVSIPMEPSGYPASEEGSRALLTGAPPTQNRQHLEWALSSVAGCVGATGGSDGLAGERFAESVQGFADMLDEVDRRGLLYLDARPGAAAPGDRGASRRRPPYHVDVVVDRAPAPGEPADAQAIDRNLADLSELALRRGNAIGLAGPPRPVLLDRIAIWSHGLAARGLVLAPLTAQPAPPPEMGARAGAGAASPAPPATAP